MKRGTLLIYATITLLISTAAYAQQDYINIFAGGGPNNVPATTAPLYLPQYMTLDSAGNFYFSTAYGTNGSNRVWKVNRSTGVITIVAGSWSSGYSGDGGLATNAQLSNPHGVAVDAKGNVFIADYYNCAVREVNAGTGIISTIAGTPNSCGFSGDNGPATSANLYYAAGIALDRNGNLFIADSNNERIRMVSCATVTSGGGACTANSGQTAGDIYTVAGNGTAGFTSDGIAATSAELYQPSDVTTDSAGNLYIADQYNHRIRRVACGTGISGCTAPSGETSGDIYTIAGNGTAGYNNDGIAATSAELYYPATVSIDMSGNLFIADQYNFRIREVACVTTTSGGGACSPISGQTAGDIYTVAGNGSAGYNGDGQPATSATVYYPIGATTDSSGNLFIADSYDYRVREVPCQNSRISCTPPTGDTAGDIYTVAGTGSYNNFFGNNIPATDADLYYPNGVASDSAGNIYIADTQNCVVREVAASTGNISTFAGTVGTCSYGGDNGPATSAYLNNPTKVAVDSSNHVYIADFYNCIVREVDTTGNITTVAGTPQSCGYSGDGGSATSAQLYYPSGVALDSSGRLYIADEYNHVVRRVSGGTISTLAGTGTAGYAGDGGSATKAELYYPTDVAIGVGGNLFIADQDNFRVRKVNTSGVITTFAGNGTAGFEGDGGPANQTSLYYPQGVAVDAAGDVLIADYSNNRIRLVDGTGTIYSIAGDGTAGFLGQNVLATNAELYQPTGVGVDPSGNMYIGDFQNWLVRKVNAINTLNSSPASASFPIQLVNTISNPVGLTLTAGGTVTINSITASPGFMETDDCGNLSNGATCAVDVSFAPTTAGSISGTLTVNYNGFFTQNLVVNLQGTATALSVSPSPLVFPSQPIGTPVTKTITVKGSTTYASPSATLTGASSFTIASNTCTGTVTTSCTIGISFKPTKSGTVKAVVAIHDSDPTNPQLVSISGTGSSFESFTPSSLTFKAQLVGTTSKPTLVTFKYSGSGSITLSSTATATANFVLTSNTCTSGAVLATNATCTFDVAFAPSTATLGAVAGNVSVTFSADPNGQTSAQLPLAGTATEVSISPASLAFGTVASGTSTKSITVTNKGTTTLTFNGTPTISGTGSAQFTILTSTSTCLNGSVTMTQGKSCTIQVQFTSTSKGIAYSETMSIADNDGASPQAVKITATD